MELRKMVVMTLYVRQQKRHRCKEQTFGLWEKVMVGCFERIALKHIYYHLWIRSPVQVQYMRQGDQDWCTGMTQFICWSLNTHWNAIWRRGFYDVTMFRGLEEIMKVGFSWWDKCPYRRDPREIILFLCHERTLEKGLVSIKRRSQTTNWPYWNPDHRLYPGLWGNQHLFFKSPNGWHFLNGSPWWLSGEEPTCNAGYLCLIPGLERSPGGEHDNSFQYSSWRIPWREKPGKL